MNSVDVIINNSSSHSEGNISQVLSAQEALTEVKILRPTEFEVLCHPE